jgi:hypothetical protein
MSKAKELRAEKKRKQEFPSLFYSLLYFFTPDFFAFFPNPPAPDGAQRATHDTGMVTVQAKRRG